MAKKGAASVGFRNRFRTAAIVGLVLAQTQLVLVAGLHLHPSDNPPVPRQTPLCSQSKNPSGPVPDHTPCIVCQIVRQSAARPAASSKLVQLISGVIFRPATALRHVPAIRTIALPVRAPPLS
ncbi:MAG: hypothetical protein ACRD2O_01230 [Terriglobia bacterium]